MSEVIDCPRWIDAQGRHWLVSEMETRHLFYTLRMIWNNRMPVPVPDNPKFYRFNPKTHSDEYLSEMLTVIASELFERDDISPWFQSQLDWMKSQLTKKIEKQPLTEAWV